MTELLLLTTADDSDHDGGTDDECPLLGYRRDSSKFTCTKCIPGMRGESCQEYKYENLRQAMRQQQQKLRREDEVNQNFNLYDISTVRNRNANEHNIRALVASWLVEYNTQNILEWGTASRGAPPSSAALLDNNNVHGSISTYVERFSPSSTTTQTAAIQSITTVDPLVPKPRWVNTWRTNPPSAGDGDDNRVVVPFLRWIPLRLADVLTNRKYEELLNTDAVDTLICWNCNAHVASSPSSSTKQGSDDDGDNSTVAAATATNQATLEGFVNVLLNQKLCHVSTLILEGSASPTFDDLVNKIMIPGSSPSAAGDDNNNNTSTTNYFYDYEWYEEENVILTSFVGRQKNQRRPASPSSERRKQQQHQRQIILLRRNR